MSASPRSWRADVAAALAGALFAGGLVVGGMTDPRKVIAFLDFGGRWDGSLAFVMGGAVVTHLVTSSLVLRRGAPLFDTKFHLPTRRDLDLRLILGAALFGIGWGLGGYCPGPGIVSLGSGAVGPLVFVATMALGMWIQRALDVSPKPAAAGQTADETPPRRSSP